MLGYRFTKINYAKCKATKLFVFDNKNYFQQDPPE